MNPSNKEYHVPVLGHEILRLLALQPNDVAVDCTLGGAGHARLLYECLGAEGLLAGIDRDADAVSYAKKIFCRESKNLLLIQGRFQDLPTILDKYVQRTVNAFLFDLGVSSHQFDTPARGFSYRYEGPLDMRMDRQSGRPLFEMLAEISSADLSGILKSYADLRHPRTLANALAGRTLSTTFELRDAIGRGLGQKASLSLLSRIFMALRIWVNDELSHLAQALQTAFERLAQGGKIAVISYHSGEDRIVKNWMRMQNRACRCDESSPVCLCGGGRLARLLTVHPIAPAPEETRQNPKARSAHLRALEKL